MDRGRTVAARGSGRGGELVSHGDRFQFGSRSSGDGASTACDRRSTDPCPGRAPGLRPPLAKGVREAATQCLSLTSMFNCSSFSLPSPLSKK